MAFGLIPAKGRWDHQWCDVLSTATFAKGALVTYDAAYRVKEYASTDSGFLGIAMSASTNSRTQSNSFTNQIMVAIPSGIGCTAYSDLTTGIAQSDLSIGKHVNIYKEGNYTSYTSTVIGHSSRFSGLAVIRGKIDSVRSVVEISFAHEGQFYSTSSATNAS